MASVFPGSDDRTSVEVTYLNWPSRLTVSPTLQVPLAHALVTRSGLSAISKMPPIWF